MNENKRIFLTGALIAGLLLVTPYYLQLIGFQAEEPVKAPDSASTTEEFFIEEPVKNTELSKSFSLSENDNKQINLNIQTASLDVLLTNHGGGSIKKATLLGSGDDSYKYLGGFNDEDVYEDSIRVSLILNPSDCAPCLSSTTNKQAFSLPFNVVSVNGQKALNNETFRVLNLIL